MATFNKLMIQTAIETDDAPTRFERFCCDILSDYYGRKILPTSAYKDLGKDGRNADPQRDGVTILCASLRKDISTKLRQDVDRILEFEIPKELIFCSSQEITEETAAKLTSAINTMFPAMTKDTVTIFGSVQLASFALDYPAAANRHYSGELTDFRRQLQATPDTDNTTGLLTLLACQLSESASELRQEVLRKLVLTLLSKSPELSDTQIAKGIGDLIGLHQTLPPSSIRDVLQQLTREKLVIQGGKVHSLSEMGTRIVAIHQKEGLKEYVNGRELVKAAFENLTGITLPQDEYAQLWKIFEELVAAMFIQNGAKVVRQIASIIDAGIQETDDNDLPPNYVPATMRVETKS